NPPPALTAFGITHAGRVRDRNEDAFGSFTEDRLFIVADGMGGHRAGEVASHMAVEELSAFFHAFHEDPRQPWPHPVERKQNLGTNLLRVGLKVANDKIRAAALADPSRAKMACTAIAMAVGDAQVSIAHAGDARAYRRRAGELKQLTTDHSILQEMIAARPGMTDTEIAAFAHRNIVTRALGSKADLEPGVYANKFLPGDLFLLCSDGLWNGVSDKRIAEILGSTTDLEAASQLLVDASNDAGGMDNITVLLVHISDG
ncbi:MAG: protein phosphatase 2C domain-containing protein, partial [Pseudomonadota bacterium]